MPKIYSEVLALLNAGNQMTWTNSLDRKAGVPVDMSSLYSSYEDAVIYAATKGAAYAGQVIAVAEEDDSIVYVLTSTSQGQLTVGTGEDAKTYEIYIKRVGTIPKGDEKTVTVTGDGLISLFGTKAEGTIPMIGTDKDGDLKGKLVWKTLEDIGAGDGNTTYQFAPLTKTNEDNVEETYGIKWRAIPLGATVTETSPAWTSIPFTVYTKSETDAFIDEVKDYVDQQIGAQIHMSTQIVEALPNVSDAEAGVIYLIANENAAAGVYLEYILVEKNGEKTLEQIGTTATDLSSYSTTEDMNKAILAALAEAEKYADDNDDNTTYAISTADSNDGKVIVTLTPSQGSAQNKTLNVYNTTELNKKFYEGSYTDKDGNAVATNIVNDTDKNGARLISPDEIKKIAGLVIDDSGNVGISSEVEASKVKGLNKAITDHVTGTTGEALGIEKGAEVNIIEAIKTKAIGADDSTATGLSVKDKTVIIPIPTKVSDLTDDTSHVSDVQARATQKNEQLEVTYQSVLEVKRVGNTITIDDELLQKKIEDGDKNALRAFTVNDQPITPDAQKQVKLTVETGSANGTIAVAGQDISVKGLGTAAYHNHGDYKTAQQAVPDPTAQTNTGTLLTYIDSISQNTNGVITPTKKSYDLQTNILTPIANLQAQIEDYNKDENTEGSIRYIAKQAAIAVETAAMEFMGAITTLPTGLTEAEKGHFYKVIEDIHVEAGTTTDTNIDGTVPLMGNAPLSGKLYAKLNDAEGVPFRGAIITLIYDPGEPNPSEYSSYSESFHMGADKDEVAFDYDWSEVNVGGADPNPTHIRIEYDDYGDQRIEFVCATNVEPIDIAVIKKGDSLVWNGSVWYVIPSGDDIEDTWRPITVTGTGNVIANATLDDAGNLTLTRGNIPLATMQVAGLIKPNSNFTVSSSGTGEVTGVSTDILFQGTKTLVLNGGTAEV